MFIVALIIFGLVCVKHDTRHEVSSFLKLANVFLSGATEDRVRVISLQCCKLLIIKPLQETAGYRIDSTSEHDVDTGFPGLERFKFMPTRMAWLPVPINQDWLQVRAACIQQSLDN